MTTIIIATEQAGLARFYLSNGSATLTQTAQVLVGEGIEPQELATIAAEMNDRFDWDRSNKPAPKPKPIAEGSVPRKKRASSPNRLKRTKVEIEAFDTIVLRYIEANQPATIPEIAKAVAGESTHANDNNIRASFERIARRVVRLVRGERSSNVDPFPYTIEGSGVGVDLGLVGDEVLT